MIFQILILPWMRLKKIFKPKPGIMDGKIRLLNRIIDLSDLLKGDKFILNFADGKI
jgi:hypothetical protein